MASMSAVSLDLETTGLDVRRDRVVSFAVVPLCGRKIVRERLFERLVQPEVPIPALATRIHGITDEMVAAAPTLSMALSELREAIGESVIVGHNIAFDLAILRHEAARRHLPWPEWAWLDTGILANALNPALAQGGLESVAEWLGVSISGRHTASGDALMAAEIYIRLLPRLRDAGVRTLAEAQCFQATAHAAMEMQEAAGWLTGVSSSMIGAATQAPATVGLERLDAYAYRHRLQEVMSSPDFVPGDALLGESARRLQTAKAGALLVRADAGGNESDDMHIDNLGILTERDVVNAIALGGSDVLATTAREQASRPVAALPQSAFVYQAIGRMQRLGTRHLAVVDAHGKVSGMVSARSLLQGRATHAILLGDRVMTADSADELAVAADQLPTVAERLLEEGMASTLIAAVISDALRHITARAAALAERRLIELGHGPAPVPWTLLMLGSAGRGESLLAPDQDNAIVYLGSGRHDPWFETFARTLVDTLNEAGIPYCSGGIMASNPAWRRSLAAWREEIDTWLTMQTVDCLHNINAFFDLEAVYGDTRVADELHDTAVRLATAHSQTLERMARRLAGLRPPIGFFGGFELESGRVNLKTAILPLVTAARILALLVGSTAHSTADRLREAAEHTLLTEDHARTLSDIHQFLVGLVLRQQLHDLRHGIVPSSGVAVSQLDIGQTRRLREALRQIDRLLRAFPSYCVRT